MAQVAEVKYKLLLLGDAGVGKSTFVKRHLTGEFEKNYVPTVEKEVLSFSFFTNRGPVKFEVWDFAGQEKMAKVYDQDFLQGQCAIIMFDVTSPITYSSVPRWQDDVVRVCGNIPTVLCGNKVDISDRKVKVAQVTQKEDIPFMYCDISVKSNYQFEKPFVWLARQMTSDQNLQFVSICTLTPPAITIDPATIAELQKCLLDEKASVLLPEEDEDL